MPRCDSSERVGTPDSDFQMPDDESASDSLKTTGDMQWQGHGAFASGFQKSETLNKVAVLEQSESMCYVK